MYQKSSSKQLWTNKDGVGSLLEIEDTIAGFGLPEEGDKVVVGGLVYEWDVVEEIDEHHERWGWVVFCPLQDAHFLCREKTLPKYETLPRYD
jgi:hypothetical protein